MALKSQIQLKPEANSGAHGFYIEDERGREDLAGSDRICSVTLASDPERDDYRTWSAFFDLDQVLIMHYWLGKLIEDEIMRRIDEMRNA